MDELIVNADHTVIAMEGSALVESMTQGWVSLLIAASGMGL